MLRSDALSRVSKKKQKLDWFLVGGWILTAWACLNTAISIQRYGLTEGFYWWFCNLALMGIAYGLLKKHRGWILGFLSIASFTQTFWIIDNVYRAATGQNLFGLVEFMYQPGLPFDEFLLSHYHYVTMPIALLALFHLPKEKSNASTLIAIFNTLIFAVSYFIFPAHQNINCIHEPCFPGLESWSGPLYSFSFWLAIFLAHLGIAHLLENYFSKKRITVAMKVRAKKGFYACAVFVVAISLWDIRYFSALPKFACRPSEMGDAVSVSCGFTLDYVPGEMLFNFQARNQTQEPLFCQMKMHAKFADGREADLVLHEGTLLKAGESQKIYTPISYPPASVVGTLVANCESPKDTASLATKPSESKPGRR